VGTLIITQVLSGSVSIFGCEVDKASTLLPLRVESDGTKAMVLCVKNNSSGGQDFKFKFRTIKAG
jgi:hypothetical protein